ncbi:heme ABC transporter ATP-binding protein/permease CydC [Vibrio aphrogenes]|uniref:heme ABC transporter ATP-binding protein/permease CydC n=1 Tax=Vibrio aphrogenes TaxID=1891186 RepID=UPI000B34B7A3|nr:cysteine/glutathione ABC transporter ATP-binding protein/permease CydC [Vibrio aphrogenes]
MRELAPYLKLYKKHWFSLSLGMFLAFATLVTSIGLLTLSGWFLSAAAVAGLTIARETFNYMLPGGGVRGFAMARTAGRWGERVVSHDATFKLLADLRIFFFQKLTPLIPGRFSKLRDADLLNRLVADVDAMDHVYLRLISPIIVGVLGIISLTLFICWFDMAIGLTLGGILLALLLLWPIIFYKLGKQNGETLTQNKAKLRIATLDWVQGHSELVLFGAEPKYRDAINHHQNALIKNQLSNAHYTGLASALLLLANGWSLVLIIWMAADGIHGQPPGPMVAMMAFATMASFELLMPIAGAFQYLGQTLESARRLNEVLSATPDVVFPASGIDTSKQYDLELTDVSYRYPDSQTNALNALSLHLPAGKKLAIVGQTGSGKSTLLQLLTRQFDVTTGSLTLAGHPIGSWTEKGLRQSISVVSQRVDILNGTLKDNLHLAKPDASDEVLLQILEAVGLSHLTQGAGLNSWLGDGGRQLSGGEKRRIGIARAILHDAPIMLLDEPTEGLDKQTETQIMQLLNQHTQGKTVVFVTHRLVGLEQMDKICLMDQGNVVEQGTHHQLLALNGLYQRLHQRL